MKMHHLLVGLSLFASCKTEEAKKEEPVAKTSVEAAQSALTKYQDVKKAMEAGYVEVIDRGFVDGEGVLFSKEGAAAPTKDTQEAANQPTGLLYELTEKDGKWALVAAVYDGGGELFGQKFDKTLHAWLWKENTGGMFAPTNASVTMPTWWKSYHEFRTHALQNYPTIKEASAAGWDHLVESPGPFMSSRKGGHWPGAKEDKITCFEHMPTGAMGLHYGNGKLMKPPAEIDLKQPQVYMFEPQPDGSGKLVGAEWLFFIKEGPKVKDPPHGAIFAQQAHGPTDVPGVPLHWQRHVWIRTSPEGIFEDWNGTVKCPN